MTLRGRVGHLEGLLRVREREMERLGRVMEQVRCLFRVLGSCSSANRQSVDMNDAVGFGDC